MLIFGLPAKKGRILNVEWKRNSLFYKQTTLAAAAVVSLQHSCAGSLESIFNINQSV